MNLPADFSDRLSPMLVKELRQGMRTNLFTISFILMQAFMVVCLMVGAGAPEDTEEVTGFFWFFVALALLGVMPIRGFGVLHRETQINTMDLIQLTRLSAWRITYGKWMAIVSQTLLLVAAILPYIVLRYFLGGIDFVTELVVLLVLCILSMMMTAITVGFSAFPSVLLRGIISAGLLFFLLVFGFGQFMRAMMMGGGSVFTMFDTTLGSEFWWSMVGLLITAAYIVYFFLDLGASRIAPESANHSTRKRLIGLGFVAFTFALPIFAPLTESMMVVGMVALIVMWIDAVTEKASLVPSILRPFVRRPLLRPAIYFLTPGWHTALPFVILSAAVVGVLIVLNSGLSWIGYGSGMDIDFLISSFAVMGCVLFPLVIIHLFFYPVTFSRFFFGLYLLIQVCLWILTLMVTIVSESSGGLSEVLYYLVPIPPVILVAHNSISGTFEAYLLIASIVCVALSLLIPIIRGRPLYRRMMEVTREIKAEKKANDPEPDSPDEAAAAPAE